jgi:hypothetical protein
MFVSHVLQYVADHDCGPFHWRAPAANLLTPYAIGKIEVMVPMCVRLKPKLGSATMTGALYVKLPRVR